MALQTVKTVNDLISQIGLLARPNRFRVEISPIGASTQRILANVPLLVCLQADVPNLTLGITNPTRGTILPMKIATSGSYDDITLTFLISEAYDVTTMFSDWMEAIFNVADNHVGFYNDYIAHMKLYPMSAMASNGDAGKDLLEIDFFDIFPIKLGNLAYDMSLMDSYMVQQVTFAYRYSVKKRI